MGDKIVVTLLENDAFRFYSSSINSLVSPAPNSMLCRCCGLCILRNRKINIVCGGGGGGGGARKGEMFPRRSRKSNSTAKCLNSGHTDHGTSKEPMNPFIGFFDVP